MDYKIYISFILKIILYLIILLIFNFIVDKSYAYFFTIISIKTQIMIKIYIYYLVSLIFLIHFIRDIIKSNYIIEKKINLILFIFLQIFLHYIFI